MDSILVALTSFLNDYLYLIPLIPLVGFAINGIFGHQLTKGTIQWIGVGSIFLSFLLSLDLLIWLFVHPDQPIHYASQIPWIHSAGLTIEWGFYIDQLSAVMICIITGVGFLIHFYSVGYMHNEPALHRFFAYMNLFTASMLVLVMADNLILMFLGWEGVGLCSYLLIAFWYENRDFAEAGKKAFIFNRIGDAGFILGGILIFWVFGTVSFVSFDTDHGNQTSIKDAMHHAASYSTHLDSLEPIYDRVTHKPLDKTVALIEEDPEHGIQILEKGLAAPSRFLGIPFETVILIIALLLFLGATGKSAQIPLYTWLPDAMAGPTPVSALIHAATMVTAGVYMMGRMYYLFAASETAQLIIVVIGALTSILAGAIAVSQNDIKKVLAYSTISQLGYMFMAMAASIFAIGIFHVMTHAFFKALLFLSAGSVIHALHHHLNETDRQDIRRMGGLRSSIPITFVCFVIGAFALSGIFPFAGFFSKDQILEGVFFHYGWVFWLLGMVSAIFTAAYTWRLIGLTFFGQCKVPHIQEHPVKETSFPMLSVIVVLGILSLVGGFVGLPAVFGTTNGFAEFLSPVFGSLHHPEEAGAIPIALMLISLFVAVGTGYVIWRLYSRAELLKLKWFDMPLGKWIHQISERKFYVDELYAWAIGKPFTWLAGMFWHLIDHWVFQWLITSVPAMISVALGKWMRGLQGGSVQGYAFLMILGLLALLTYFMVLLLNGLALPM